MKGSSPGSSKPHGQKAAARSTWCVFEHCESTTYISLTEYYDHAPFAIPRCAPPRPFRFGAETSINSCRKLFASIPLTIPPVFQHRSPLRLAHSRPRTIRGESRVAEHPSDKPTVRLSRTSSEERVVDHTQPRTTRRFE